MRLVFINSFVVVVFGGEGMLHLCVCVCVCTPVYTYRTMYVCMREEIEGQLWTSSITPTLRFETGSLSES